MWSGSEPIDRMMAAFRSSIREFTLIAILNDIPRLMRHPTWRKADPEQGNGRGVLLVPGFGFSDRSLTLARTWFTARGYRPVGSHTGFNVGCTTELVGQIEQRLEEHADQTGGRVILFGQSRGGWLSRIVATRRPDLVRGLVMLGSAVLNPLGGHPRAVRAARMLTRIAAAGLPGVLDEDCFTGRCFRRTSLHLATPLPGEVPAVSVYSRIDRIAPWRLCLDPYARCVEVGSSHTGMGLDPNVYTSVEPALAEWSHADAHAERMTALAPAERRGLLLAPAC